MALTAEQTKQCEDKGFIALRSFFNAATKETS